MLLQRAWVWFPGPHGSSHLCNSSSRGSDALFWPPQIPGACAQTYMRENTQIYKLKINLREDEEEEKGEGRAGRSFLWRHPEKSPSETFPSLRKTTAQHSGPSGS